MQNLDISKRFSEKIQGHNFTKELKDFEYEIKFDLASDSDAFASLKKLRACFKDNQHFILCEIERGDKLVTRVSFFTKDSVEYSLFKYRGARMIKVKKHKIIKASPFKIFKNRENLLIDRKDFLRLPKNTRQRFGRHNYRLIDVDKVLEKIKSAAFFGKMIKTRVKDFVLDARDGRIYAVAVTFCSSNKKSQKQLEVEYSGFLSGFKRPRGGLERQIIAGTEELSKHIRENSSLHLTPSVERKFEFVKKTIYQNG